MVVAHTHRGRFCIDRYEAALVRVAHDGRVSRWPGNRSVDGVESEMMAISRRGVEPQGYISGRQAALACEHAGKRLCTEDEWASACRGPGDKRYPYGARRRGAACNDRPGPSDDHPVLRLFEAHAKKGEDRRDMWLPRWMNDPRLHELPRTVTATGAFAECTNEYGAFDMVGNLHEWLADSSGVFAGGYFMDTARNGQGCEYRTRAHGAGYHDYSTGFRCCADAPAAD
jgi:formylglycine-generating enzyme required for sulfatase activity